MYLSILFFVLLASSLHSVRSQQCGPGQVLSPINNKCANCSEFLPGCTTCSSPSICTVCMPGYKLNVTDCIAESVCQPGSYKDSSGNCASCVATLPNCIYCEVGTACMICGDGYSVSAGKCVQIQNISCEAGSYYDASKGSCVNCSSVVQGCVYCTNSTHCTACAPGTNLTAGACVVIKNKTCQPGQYLDYNTQTCHQCSEAHSNCSACDNETSCTKCVSNTVLLGGSCYPPEESCPSGAYYNVPSKSCFNCTTVTANCWICTGPKQCTICADGFKLVNGQCQAGGRRLRRKLQEDIFGLSGNALCPSSYGYYTADKTCYVCPRGCDVCTKASGVLVCLACDKHAYREGLVCKHCGLSMCHCDTCLTNNFCLTCEDGYYLSGASACLSCEDAIIGCSKCSSAHYCTKCYDPYSLNTNTGKCECNKPNCYTCIKEYPGCLKCKSGYYREDTGLCKACHKTCAECEMKGNSMCLSCPPNAQLAKVPGKDYGFCACDPGYNFDWGKGQCVMKP